MNVLLKDLPTSSDIYLNILLVTTQDFTIKFASLRIVSKINDLSLLPNLADTSRLFYLTSQVHSNQLNGHFCILNIIK